MVERRALPYVGRPWGGVESPLGASEYFGDAGVCINSRGDLREARLFSRSLRGLGLGAGHCSPACGLGSGADSGYSVSDIRIVPHSSPISIL